MFDLIHRIKKPINTILSLLGLYVIVNVLVVKFFSKRERLSKKYIKGSGLEIGALHTPLKVFNKARVKYIDRMSVKDLRNHYPELVKFPFIKVDIVDDGELLKKIKDNSQDFIIANHFIEHCENPIEVFKNHLRILKKGGILYWAVPDKRYTFDKVRETTLMKHFFEDYRNGPLNSRKKHYEEWVGFREEYKHFSKGEKVKKAKKLMEDLYSIHFHTWTMESFTEFLEFIKQKTKLSFEIVENVKNINEFIVIVRKK